MIAKGNTINFPLSIFYFQLNIKATEVLRRLFAYTVLDAAFSGFMGARVEMACL